jgi:hypothetical protein
MAPARSRLGDVIVFAGISLFGVAFTAMLADREYQEYKDAAVADGIVTKLNAGGAHPEIEFTTPDGQTVSYPQGGMIGGYKPGDHVRVLELAVAATRSTPAIAASAMVTALARARRRPGSRACASALPCCFAASARRSDRLP